MLANIEIVNIKCFVRIKLCVTERSHTSHVRGNSKSS